jgi:hypothetical protein
MSYLLSRIERRPRGEFRKRGDFTIRVFFTRLLKRKRENKKGGPKAAF